MSISSILSEIRRKLDAYEDNQLVVERDVLKDRLAPPSGSYLRIVIGEPGSGKSVLARALVNKVSKERGDLGIVIHLRYVNLSLIERTCDIRDPFELALIELVKRPRKIMEKLEHAVYFKYPLVPEDIFSGISCKDLRTCLQAIGETLKKIKRNMFIVVDEFDSPQDVALLEKISNPNERANIVLNLSKYLREVNDSLARYGVSLIITLMMLTRYGREVRGVIEGIARTRPIDTLAISRMEYIELPKNMSKHEYYILLRNLCNYLNMECSEADLRSVASILSHPSSSPYLVSKIILTLVENTIKQTNCKDIECLKATRLKFKVDELVKNARILDILDTKTWPRKIESVGYLIDPRRIERKLIEKFIEYLREDADIGRDGVRGIVEKRSLGLNVTWFTLMSSRRRSRPLRVAILSRLYGKDLAITKDTVLAKILPISRLEEIGGKGEIHRLKAPLSALVVFRHKGVDIYQTTRAIENLYGGTIIIIDEPIWPDALYCLIEEETKGRIENVDNPLTYVFFDATSRLKEVL